MVKGYKVITLCGSTRFKDEFIEVHKRKIDMSDEIYVINVGGYIGSSTRTEIAYAKETGKTVHYLEDNITE